MIILGIDPGIATTGYGIIKKEAASSNLGYIACGCINTPAALDVPTRLLQIHRILKRIIKKYKPDRAAIEQLFFANNTKTALIVAHARGTILSTLAASGVIVDEYTPLQVKQALTGYGRAEKAQMQKMVQLILKLSNIPRPDDAADALAIAVCCAHSFNATIH